MGKQLFALLVFACGNFAMADSPTINLVGKTYHLGSYNQTSKPTWEFVTGNEKIDTWTTLVTVIERGDAHSRPDLDRLAEGIMANYKAHSAQVLMAKTFPSAGGAYNYMVAAFEEPAKHRFELNFVKIGLGAKNAYIVIYAARVTDPLEPLAKGKQYLNQHSSEIGDALEKLVLPDLSAWPRKVF